MKSVKRLLQFLRPFRGQVFMNVVFNALSTLFGLFSLLMIIPFLEILFEPESPGEITKPAFSLSIDWVRGYFNYLFDYLMRSNGKEAALIFVCALVIATSLLKNIFRYLALHFLAPVRSGVVKRLRESFHDKLLQLPISYFTHKRKGDLLTRTSSDISEIEYSILGITETFFKEPVAILLSLATLFILSPQLTAMVLLLLPVTALIIGRIGKGLKQAARRSQSKLGEILTVVEETISGLRIIKAFNAERARRDLFTQINTSHYQLNTKLTRRNYLASPLMEVLSTIVIVIIIYIGSRLVLGDALPAHEFLAYIAIFAMIINPAKAFSSAAFNVRKGMASVERIDSVLAEDERIRDLPDAVPLQEFKSQIEYRHVTFAYGEFPVVRDASVVIPKGRLVALVGESGSGKSTFADLLPRFHDVQQGEILIDGNPIRSIRLSDLRRLMGIVTQEPLLFHDTVFNNIAFGKPDASEEEVVAAARTANAHNFITALPQGYRTLIGERGARLSGGERQRITIARAVLKNPPILILDEATSSLDSESERLVQEALTKLMAHRTSIVIAHRLSTIQHADEILVLEAGTIVERGPHHELMQKGGIYKRLVELQAF
jgi:subfamily B ATP-binding cassette protein MsbA